MKNARWPSGSQSRGEGGSSNDWSSVHERNVIGILPNTYDPPRTFPAAQTPSAKRGDERTPVEGVGGRVSPPDRLEIEPGVERQGEGLGERLRPKVGWQRKQTTGHGQHADH